MRLVLDSSGMLAVLRNEERGAELRPHLADSAIGTVNLAEVATILNRRGFNAYEATTSIEALRVPVLATSASLAIEAGVLEGTTRSAGLSLGDRFALTLARRLGLILVTSDRRLAGMAGVVGVHPWLLVTPGPGNAR